MRKNEEKYNPAATGGIERNSKWGCPQNESYMYVELKMLPVRRAAEEVINEEGRVGYEV